MSESILKVSPVDSIMINVSTPSVVEIILELSLVNKVVDLSAEALKLPCLVNLAESTLEVVLRHSQMVVDGATRILY